MAGRAPARAIRETWLAYSPDAGLSASGQQFDAHDCEREVVAATAKRALESSVIVDDKSIVVLGGLIQDSQENGTDKLPVAGDIPFFGQLFRYDNRRRIKTNLLVFIKPTVVRSDSQGRALTSERYDYIMNQQQNNFGKPVWFWSDQSTPELPPQGVLPGTPAATPGGALPPPDPPIPRL